MFAPSADSSFKPSKGVFAVDNQPVYSSSFAALNKTGTDEDKDVNKSGTFSFAPEKSNFSFSSQNNAAALTNPYPFSLGD